MKFSWHAGSRAGTLEIVPGENHVRIDTGCGTIFSRVSGTLRIAAAPAMFFNGYQSWTHCPEFTAIDRIRSLHGLPKFIGKMLALDHFADYHFINYTQTQGVLHGFSWCYFRDGSHYRLFASLDERPGYTVFTYDVRQETLKIERDCSGVLQPGPEFAAFDIFYAEGSGDEVFDSWFTALGIHNAPPAIKGYSSWYNHYQNINEKRILDDLDGARKLFSAGDLFQIDDGWEPFVGDWETANPEKFPRGLQPLVREIHDAGFKAGLWLAPFVCERRSGIFREHPDWLLQYQGKPWKAGPNWSGDYALDIDHPEVRAYLERVFRLVFDVWKFDLVKLDFLYAAAPFATGDHGVEDGKPYSESRAGRMIRAMNWLRELCGDKLILACGVPLMPAFGVVDYCRIGCDVSLNWDDFPLMRILHRERVSTRQSLDNTIFRRQLDGRAFGSDPDVFFLRENNLRLNSPEKSYLLTANALFGSVWLTSDDLNAYDDPMHGKYRAAACLKQAQNIRIDQATLNIRFTLNGKEHQILYPHPRKQNRS